VLSRYRAAVGRAWRLQWREVLVAGVLNVLTYVIVLAAMKLSGSKIGYIVPLRETSIVLPRCTVSSCCASGSGARASSAAA
jgi:hypothetical protein